MGSDLYKRLQRRIDAEIERVKEGVDVAAAYGWQIMRHDATYGYDASIKHSRGFDNALPRLVKGYRAVTEYAATKGVKPASKTTDSSLRTQTGLKN